MMEVTVREAQMSDAEVMADFNRAMAVETEDVQLDPQTVLNGVKRGLERSQHCRYFLAEFRNEVVGQAMITYEWSDWRDGMVWWFQSVYVHPDHRRRGVFRSLYRHVVGLARNTSDVCGMRLYVEQGNERAQQAYQDLGMSATGYKVYEVLWTDESS